MIMNKMDLSFVLIATSGYTSYWNQKSTQNLQGHLP